MIRRAAPSSWLALPLLLLCACAARPIHFTGQALDARPAVDFTLTDQRGLPFRLSDERGRVVVLFFGYTSCSDTCPATLATLHRVLELTPASRERPAVLFITVDPARDTPRRLADFVGSFDHSFIGLTGPPQALDNVYAAYRIFHMRVPAPNRLTYLEAHDSPVYIIDRSGALRVMHGPQDTARAITSDVTALAS